MRARRSPAAVALSGAAATAVLLAGLVRAPAAAQDPQPVFRAGADAVTVGVSVTRNNRPVTHLTVADFAVTDNGVRQHIAGLSYETLPIDATLLFDVSGSVTGAVRSQLRRSIPDFYRDLRPGDRLSLVTFDMRIGRLLNGSPAPEAIDAAFAQVETGGSSAIYDALAVALSARGAPDRRQFVVLFSDGRDSISISTSETLLDLARRTSPTVSVVLSTPARAPSDRVYAELAAETGGTMVSLLPTDTLDDSLRGVLARFRSSYVLTYIPTGVTRAGAHAIDVTVNRAGVDVRARRGYFIRGQR